MATQEEQNIAAVKAAYECAYKGDWDGFFSALADDAEVHEAASLPYGGVYKGKEMIKSITPKIFATWDDFNFEIVNYTAGGDLVVLYILQSGIGKKTGKSFSDPMVEMWRFKDGKVIELRPFYYDTARCVECYGS